MMIRLSLQSPELAGKLPETVISQGLDLPADAFDAALAPTPADAGSGLVEQIKKLLSWRANSGDQRFKELYQAIDLLLQKMLASDQAVTDVKARYEPFKQVLAENVGHGLSLALYARLGLGPREIGRLVGRDRSTVRKHLRTLRTLGLVPPATPASNQQRVLPLASATGREVVQ
ncbi:helix-turn-helix domain-containing protein [Candidatus Thiosymbion oneisti]|uniref:helix-turn-helix domain-containing protein n=1 Tax=Candidatus Thiosymbion oneisti TaxID=589554 RepID=UPI000B7D48FC|nr:helix-turn-helix domain-containing protein [Candidatus Thiosymbion oneisti]